MFFTVTVTNIKIIMSWPYCDPTFRITLITEGWAPCNKGDFNLNGGPYKIFWMILSFVSKIFLNVLVFKILNEGVMLNQHSKSVTKLKFVSQLHLALQQDILSASAFYTQKDSYANYLSHGTLQTCAAIMGAELGFTLVCTSLQFHLPFSLPYSIVPHFLEPIISPFYVSLI